MLVKDKSTGGLVKEASKLQVDKTGAEMGDSKIASRTVPDMAKPKPLPQIQQNVGGIGDRQSFLLGKGSFDPTRTLSSSVICLSSLRGE